MNANQKNTNLGSAASSAQGSRPSPPTLRFFQNAEQQCHLYGDDAVRRSQQLEEQISQLNAEQEMLRTAVHSNVFDHEEDIISTNSCVESLSRAGSHINMQSSLLEEERARSRRDKANLHSELITLKMELDSAKAASSTCEERVYANVTSKLGDFIRKLDADAIIALDDRLQGSDLLDAHLGILERRMLQRSPSACSIEEEDNFRLRADLEEYKKMYESLQLQCQNLGISSHVQTVDDGFHEHMNQRINELGHTCNSIAQERDDALREVAALRDDVELMRSECEQLSERISVDESNAVLYFYKTLLTKTKIRKPSTTKFTVKTTFWFVQKAMFLFGFCCKLVGTRK